MCLSHKQVKLVVQQRCRLDSVEADAAASALLASQKGGFENKRELIDHLAFIEDPESGECRSG